MKPFSIRTKLTLTLMILGLLIVFGTHAFVQWSFKRGIETFAEERHEQRIDRIGERLSAVYAADGSWKRLRSDRMLWLSELFGRRGSHQGGHPHTEIPRPLRRWLRRNTGEPGLWPPKRAMEPPRPGDHPKPLELRLLLLDADGSVVIGRPELVDGAKRYPLALEGQPIGALALLPGPSITELSDQRYRERQHGYLWLIASGMALLSMLLAIPLSARLTRPIAVFRSTMGRLAHGDFSARVPYSRQMDEVARLGVDLNALAQTLEHNEKARKRWVADISHELRTPVSLLRAEIEAMQDGLRPLDQDVLASLHADVLRLGRLVDDLYELSVTDVGLLSCRKEPVDLAELLENEIQTHHAEFREQGLELELDRQGAGPWQLSADPQRLSQLFRNLLRNSLRYTDRGGRLVVTLGCDGPSIHIRFDDSPPGVADESLPKLFERLYRADASRSRATGGAGLGLAIARNIAEAHGGRISAAQSPLGGLRIDIELPTNR